MIGSSHGIVIAPISPIKSSILLLLCAAGLALLSWGYWGEPSARWFDAHPHDDGTHWRWNQALTFIIGPILLLMPLYALRLWWRYGNDAVTVENGVLKGPSVELKLSEIQDISIGRPNGWDSPVSIILKLRDGSQSDFPVATLTEPGPVILARLQHALKRHRSA